MSYWVLFVLLKQAIKPDVSSVIFQIMGVVLAPINLGTRHFEK